MQHFTAEQKQYARKADLYAFLMANHAGDFKIDGMSIHPRNNGSLSIKRGYSGYMDFATGDKGNSIDFLVKYMNYGIDEAVLALCGGAVLDTHVTQTQQPPKVENLPPTFPEPMQGRYKNLYAYLMKRGISSETIQMLIDANLLYQESEHNNIVFANAERTWGELHGTYTYTQDRKSFHGMIKNSQTDGYWAFQTAKDVDVVYICEASIDAISLYELHRMEGRTENACYVSVGGVAKQPAIDRIKSKHRVIMAVDNDEAGADCRRRNAELESIYPINKDWNEDLQEYLKAVKNDPKTTTGTPETDPVSDAVPASPECASDTTQNAELPPLPDGYSDPYGKEHELWVRQMMQMVGAQKRTV
jgi:hypothetical protein